MNLPRSLQPHPRLYIGPAEIARLRQPAAGWTALRQAAKDVAARAAEYAQSAEFPWVRNTHNAHLVRARTMQTRVLTLLVRYLQTRDPRFRDAILAHVRAMGQWEYWSWIAWRRKDPRPNAIFDLSYGENSATLAVAYDLLAPELTSTERRLFVRLARDRALRPCLANLRRKPGKRAWWYRRTDSNWNAVCAGGAGLLCLAMHDELPEARRLLPLLDGSIRRYMEHFDETGGGWEEGVGYWNYGMRYALTYLLSMTRATGQIHPLLRRPATRRALRFPLDFCPNGAAAGFNDSNAWSPVPVHLAAAVALGEREVAALLCRAFERGAPSRDKWPDAAELLLLHPRVRPAAVRVRENPVVLYPGLDWGFLADRVPGPSFYASVRGGSSAVPHGQRDLMSFNVVVGDETLVLNPQSGRYLDTTFSPRRDELYDLTPAAKNVILINGVGVEPRSRVETRLVRIGGLPGIRMDATKAMGRTYDRQAARFCGRLFLMLAGRALLILDRVEADHAALVENRLNTLATVTAGTADARITGRRHSCSVAFAATRPATLVLCRPALTWPVEPPTLLRWATADLHTSVTLATAIVPGRERLDLRLTESKRTVTVRLAGRGWHHTLVIPLRLA